MGEVLKALEGPVAPMICVTDDASHVACGRTGYCTVNYMWVRVRDAITGALDSMSLADLVPVGARLGRPDLSILGAQADPAARPVSIVD
jgi:DNA-binding IscR family transcriptional regulator